MAVTNDCCDMTQDKGTHWVKTGGNCDRKHVPMIQTSTGGTEQESGGGTVAGLWPVSALCRLLTVDGTGIIFLGRSL